MIINYGEILYFQGLKGLEGGEGGKYIRGIWKRELLATEPPAELELGFVLSFLSPPPSFCSTGSQHMGHLGQQQEACLD